MKLLPKTEEYLRQMEEIYRMYVDERTLDSISDEEKNILYNPMLHLAEAIYMDVEGWHGNTWAHKLRDYLNVLCEDEKNG